MIEGNESEFGVALSSVRLVGGQEIPIQASGVTAIVGANNSGKSTLLREIVDTLSHNRGLPQPARISVESVDLSTRGGPADVVAWLGRYASFVARGTVAGFQKYPEGIVRPANLLRSWGKRTAELGQLANFVVFYGNAQGRFSIGAAAEMRHSIEDPPEHPVHYLQDSRDLLEQLSEISREVFDSPLTLDTLGRTIQLRVGEIGMEAPPIDNISRQYRERMATLRPLDEQGDGMRSMMGQLIPVITASYKIIVLDEPEAFLHPPQAHALGVQLGRLAVREGIQILLATHDRSLLTGLLESGVEVSVVRLSRTDGSPVQASSLDASELRSLWADPVLKYTNVLDGLFHRLVVVAEAERDCAFLSAAMETTGMQGDQLPRNEILFVPTGGKDGMPKVCSALSAVRVPVVATPDLDMLSDKSKLRGLVEAIGEEWTESLERNWNVAAAQINAPKETAKVEHVLEALISSLEPYKQEGFTPNHREIALGHLRSTGSPWGAVKEHGLSAFKGEARRAAGELLRELDQLGVVLVEVGELEKLAPEISVRKGAGWLQAALAANEHLNDTTQAHIGRILRGARARVRPVVD